MSPIKAVENERLLVKRPGCSWASIRPRPGSRGERKFLVNVVLVLSWDDHAEKNPVLWHRALALIDTAANFGLNPRLQLEALLN